MRVLVAFEEQYRAYHNVIAAGIEVLRPSVEVATTRAEDIAQEIARFDPRVVISSQPEAESPAPMPAWIKLPLDPTQPTEVRLGGHRWTSAKPTLETLVAVIDELEAAGSTKMEEAVQ